MSFLFHIWSVLLTYSLQKIELKGILIISCRLLLGDP